MAAKLVGLAAALAALSCTSSTWTRLVGEDYELDGVSRRTNPSEPPSCHPEHLQIYRGETVRLEPPVTLAPPFRPRLLRFEALVAKVGERVYGRAPSRILNAGAYACRPVEHRQGRLSEHALGNALDVTGFRFPPRSARASAVGGAPSPPPVLPRALERGFTITVSRHFREPAAGAAPTAQVHRQFFVELVAELRRERLFRGMLGPSDPRHATHLHLDMAPWPYERLGP